MDLQEFVTETLTQIANGVVEAQKRVADTGANINPSTEGMTGISVATEKVEFDVALTVEKGKGSKGGIGVFVGPVGVGSQGQSESRDTSLSRVTFSVPIILPPGPVCN